MSRKMIKLHIRMFRKYYYAMIQNLYEVCDDSYNNENARRLIRHVNDGNLHRTLSRMAD